MPSTVRAAPTDVTICKCAARKRALSEARSPSGASLRHSPPAVTPMAQLQTLVSWDVALAGVLPAFGLSQSSELLTVRS
jgi:hypothetical protein